MSCCTGATRCQDVVNCCSTLDNNLILITKTAEEAPICLSLIYWSRKQILDPERCSFVRFIKGKIPKSDFKSENNLSITTLNAFLTATLSCDVSEKTLKSEKKLKKGPFCPPTNQIELMSRILATGIQSEDTISQSASCNTTETGSKAQTARVSQQR